MAAIAAERRPFFSFDLRQPINQWLGIALVGLMCFWVVLYYLVNKTAAFGQEVSTANAQAPVHAGL
ncbi:MAG: hypothetical protein KGI69_02270 [Patescibacteria group bacterium]|nr:hypothetical protein [Patescibacteria group bacterium]